MMNFFFLTLIILIFTIMMLILSVFMLFTSFSFMLDFELMNIYNNSFNFILYIDFFSIIFFMTVMLISLSVYIFSNSYMSSDKYFTRFHYLLLSFVLSMVLLIMSPNLISILLGWDGLGISSYLLVIYYSSSKSYNAGMITMLSNRVGDALIIISLGSLMFLNNMNLFMLFYIIDMNMFMIFILLLLAACTKSAQIPFSAWLPAAMAAPTPVSSLVHSSTLVTAGVYLMIRFENLLMYLNISKILLYLGCLTMFMASLSAFFEMDMKKMVALSTLSQLGVMMTSLGAGLYMMSFFHLLTHAFFKALLFISAGNLIHSSESYQDLRTMGGNSEILPISTSIVIGASMSLCGLPFMSAFYSKELIIESLLMYNMNIFSYILMIMGVFMTLFYSLRFLMLAMMSFNRQRSLFNKSDKDYIVNFSMFMLLLPAIMGGSFISLKMKMTCSLLMVSNLMKYMVYFLLVLSVFMYMIFYKNNIVIFNKSLWSFSSMWGMPFFSSRFSNLMYMNFGDFLHKVIDFSWIFFFFSNFFYKKIKNQSLSISFISMNFIRILNNMFFIMIIIIYLYN